MKAPSNSSGRIYVSRRAFLKAGAVAGAATLVPLEWLVRRAQAFTAAPTLDPTTIDKYVQALVIPPAMPRTTKLPGGADAKKVDYYEIALRQFQQQILPPGMPPTTVWSYGSVNHPETFNYPAFTIEARYRQPVRVTWINGLVDASGHYLPHLLPVDPTLHWANPAGPIDARPAFTATPGPYSGPVPIVTHVHGAHTGPESDGYAEAWYLPAATNIPDGYTTTGSWYDTFKADAAQLGYVAPGTAAWQPGTAVFQYPNDQRATTLWYHDHTLGMTRLNVYAGPAGFYIVRGGPDDEVRDAKGNPAVLPGPAPALGDPPGRRYYEIPLAIQDRSFNADGSLFFPDSRAFFDEFAGPAIPASDIPPIWNPEFFGNAIVVNGRTWPRLDVEQRRYRFRLLNGCNARFLILAFDNGLPLWQIGAEGGFLPRPVQLPALLLGPAERADVIVDFTGVPVGTAITLLNLGPDTPFGGGVPGIDFEPANPATTGQVMQLRVVARRARDTSTPPAQLVLPPLGPPAPPAGPPRQVSLNEMMSLEPGFDGPVAALLGVMHAGVAHHRMWDDEITERPAAGIPERWEIYNFTADAHPIHLHQVMFQVVDRQALALDDDGEVVQPVGLDGPPRPPEAWETGFKDTVIAYPGQVTRINATFDLKGRYVWHCHIVDHEDNEMMRPFEVV